jgi:predicted O-methyltransferase YrrM
MKDKHSAPMQHYYHSIDGWFNFQKLYRSQVERARNGAVFVEVGAYKGRSAAYMAVEIHNSGKQIDFHVVDVWDEHPYKEVFIRNVASRFPFVTVHHMGSVVAARKFPERSVDFIFIDGSHSYKNVKKDIFAWLPRMKPAGIMAGHDYVPHFDGVVRAVAEIFETVRMEGTSWVYECNSRKLENKL